MSDQPRTITLPALLGIGTTFGVCVGICVFAGVIGDSKWGTSPLLALVGLGVGIFVGAASAYQVIRPFTRPCTASITTQSARPDDSAD